MDHFAQIYIYSQHQNATYFHSENVSKNKRQWHAADHDLSVFNLIKPLHYYKNLFLIISAMIAKLPTCNSELLTQGIRMKALP